MPPVRRGVPLPPAPGSPGKPDHLARRRTAGWRKVSARQNSPWRPLVEADRALVHTRRRRTAANPPERSLPGRPGSSMRSRWAMPTSCLRRGDRARPRVDRSTTETPQFARSSAISSSASRASSRRPASPRAMTPIPGSPPPTTQERTRRASRRSISPAINSVCSKLVGTLGSSRRASAWAAMDASLSPQ